MALWGNADDKTATGTVTAIGYKLGEEWNDVSTGSEVWTDSTVGTELWNDVSVGSDIWYRKG